MNKFAKVIIDRPLGSYHPTHKDICYTVNYGYIPVTIAGDLEEQDAYILGVDIPLQEFEGEVIAIIHRKDDIEDKWVVIPTGTKLSEKQIQELVHFQEQYFDIFIEMLI